MPFDKNEVNSNDSSEYNNSNDFENMNDNEDNSNYIPYYYGESPDFSIKPYSDIDAAGQFAYKNNINNGNYNKTYSLFSPNNNYQVNILFPPNKIIFGNPLFENSNLI